MRVTWTANTTVKKHLVSFLTDFTLLLAGTILFAGVAMLAQYYNASKLLALGLGVLVVCVFVFIVGFMQLRGFIQKYGDKGDSVHFTSLSHPHRLTQADNSVAQHRLVKR